MFVIQMINLISQLQLYKYFLFMISFQGEPFENGMECRYKEDES